MLSACAHQSPHSVEALRRADVFIPTIETMKHSVAPVVCLDQDGPKADIQDREGTAFFISPSGEFLTAAHVLDDIKTHNHPCPVTAIYLPTASWRPDTPEETVHWFPFHTASCVIERAQDVAKCPLEEDLSIPRLGFSFRIKPVQVEFSDQADGTQVAFTGFPLGARDPFTSRGGIATYRRSADTAQMVLDQTAWPGASGSPVYLSDGRVIGIMLARGIAQGSGIAIVRPARWIRPMLEKARRVSGREQCPPGPSDSCRQ
jgi:S1-C subfamily serine protease